MEPSYILKIYGPIILFIILLVFSIFGGLERLKLHFANKGFSIGGTIVSKKVIRILTFIVAVILLMIPYCIYDYTKFFPKELKMTVFYDQRGIKKSLEQFTKQELKEMRVVLANHDSLQIEYYNLLNKEILKRKITSDFFDGKNKNIYSKGKAKIIIEPAVGFQTYVILEVEGYLNNYYDQPMKKSIGFKTRFVKQDSPNDKFSISFKEIFANKVVLKPKFKQFKNFTDGDIDILYHHNLYGYTPLKIFPKLTIENTVYFWEKEGVGLIPIGYAVYD